MEPQIWRRQGSRFPLNILAGWDLARFTRVSLPAAKEYLEDVTEADGREDRRDVRTRRIVRELHGR